MRMWSTGQGIYLHANACITQWLLQRAWNKTLRGQRRVKPWLWADSWPVARLRAPQHGVDTIVLAGEGDQPLACGPGYHLGSGELGQEGSAVITAHRDTHFKFLKKICPGDTLIIQTADNVERTFQVAETQIVDEEASIILNTSGQMLTLITCYPFDDLPPGGSLRFLVFAVPQPELLV